MHHSDDAPPELPRLRSITGVARALIGTVGVEEAVHVLLTQFGWDVTTQALAGIDGTDGEAHAGHALWLAVEALSRTDQGRDGRA